MYGGPVLLNELKEKHDGTKDEPIVTEPIVTYGNGPQTFQNTTRATHKSHDSSGSIYGEVLCFASSTITPKRNGAEVRQKCDLVCYVPLPSANFGEILTISESETRILIE
jgi:hypothetical protein